MAYAVTNQRPDIPSAAKAWPGWSVCQIGAVLTTRSICVIALTLLSVGTLLGQSAPQILSEPKSRVVLSGKDVRVEVSATGTAPLEYQWIRDGAAFLGATNPVLILTNATPALAGEFSVMVTNLWGSVTSGVARLTVLPVPPPTTAAVWGTNGAGQVNVPAGLTGLVGISAGYAHLVAVNAAGGVVAWGDNSAGQCDVPATLTNALSVAGGYLHSLALRADGTVLGWGDNGFGQATPPSGLNNAIAVAAGGFHSLALRSDGSVLSWGDNRYGQTAVPAGLANVTAIAAGGFFSAALKADGTVTAWGYNGGGEVSVPLGISNVAQISAGFSHTLALLVDGSVVAWGFNGSGQTNVPAGLTGVAAVTAGLNHSLALTHDGGLVTWGVDGNGVARLPGALLTNPVAIAAGAGFSAALTPAPFIRAPPTNQLLVVGSNHIFPVIVNSAEPPAYQWLFNNALLAGETNNSLTITNAQAGNEGLYKVMVSNSYGVVQSDAVALAFLPAIVIQPSNQTNIAGTDATFNVVASGLGPLTYRWRFLARLGGFDQRLNYFRDARA